MNYKQKREHFRKEYSDFNDKDLMIELLVANSAQIDKLEKVRSNLSKIVWFFIGIPILFFVLILFFGGLAGALSAL